MVMYSGLITPFRHFTHYLLQVKIPGLVAHGCLRNTPEYPTMNVNFIYPSLVWFS
jgi:hypothetical protein